MKISTKGRYALRLMMDLAENNTGSPISLKDVAKRQDISDVYKRQVKISHLGFQSLLSIIQLSSELSTQGFISCSTVCYFFNKDVYKRQGILVHLQIWFYHLVIRYQ